jgi:hypothetical protein
MCCSAMRDVMNVKLVANAQDKDFVLCNNDLRYQALKDKNKLNFLKIYHDEKNEGHKAPSFASTSDKKGAS